MRKSGTRLERTVERRRKKEQEGRGFFVYAGICQRDRQTNASKKKCQPALATHSRTLIHTQEYPCCFCLCFFIFFFLCSMYKQGRLGCSMGQRGCLHLLCLLFLLKRALLCLSRWIHTKNIFLLFLIIFINPLSPPTTQLIFTNLAQPSSDPQSVIYSSFSYKNSPQSYLPLFSCFSFFSLGLALHISSYHNLSFLLLLLPFLSSPSFFTTFTTLPLFARTNPSPLSSASSSPTL